MDARNKHAKQYQSDRNGSTEQTRPDPLSALRVLREEGAVRNVNVGRMTAWWEIKLNTQGSRKTSSSFADVTLPSPATEGAQDILGHQPWSAADLATRDLLGLMPWSAADLATRDLLGLMPWSAADLATRDLLGLMELMVEMVFPCCAICQLDDNDVSLNTTSMSALHSGEDYKGAMGWWLTAGSRAEGLALETGWGHPPADIDTMYLYGGRLGVYVPGGHTPQASASLQYQPEGCRPAYCKLKVINPTALNLALSCYIDISGERHMQVQSCIDKEEGQQWLNTYQTQWLMVDSDETFSSPAGRHGLTVSGPAGKRGLNDFVTTLVCSAPHPDLQRKFSDHSHKQWLPAHVINYILKLPMLLVLVGHKLSIHSKSEARISWSHCEMKIMQELPENVRQGYIACKYVLKRFQGPTEPGDGRSRVSSFHIKTTLLHHLEKRSPHTITSPFRLFIDLLHRLDRYIELGKLPHYFLADCNLLETVGKQELSIARQAIQAILLDPLAALLTSPTDPPQIYGEVCPDALVNSFRRVVTHPMYEQSWNDLFPLLASVDTCRQNRYHRQQKTDGRWVSQRHELSGLCEALKRIK